MARKSRRKNIFHHYLVPGAHNNHQPHFLRAPNTALLAAATVLFFAVTLGLQGLVIRSPSPQIGAVVASVLVDLANDDREKEGAPELVVNPVLVEAAQMKADDMAAKGYFAHDSPEGIKPWHWFEKAGYAYSYAGENLAVFFTDSAEVESAWMNSPLHRANILGEQFTEIGIALAHGNFEGEDTTFVVQMFGTPAVSAAERSITAGIAAQSEETQVPSIAEGDTVAGASAQIESPMVPVAPSTNVTWRLLSAPTTTLQYIYMTLGALIVLALGLLFTVELKRLHVPSLVRGAGLLALIIGLYLGGTAYFSGELLIL